MRNLNEGKKKASAYMAELAEIDKQSAVVAMEAKINKLAEMVEAKTQRLSMVSEDENLSELIDKKRVKMMEREIKEIERAKLKLEKLYEKMTGGKKKEMVDEEEKMDETYGSTTYEEDDSTYEEDDMKESTNEEYLRMQKLAGVISEEEYRNRLNEAKEMDMAKSFLKGKGFEVKTVDGSNEVYDNASKLFPEGSKTAYMWDWMSTFKDGTKGQNKHNGKDVFAVYIPFDEDLLKEIKSKLPVLSVQGKSGTFYDVIIEKK